MRSVIGILLREEEKKLYVKKELFYAIINSGGMPIGIYLNNSTNNEMINLCDGFILPGGDDYTKEELFFIKKLYDLNKKVLGICLGMQEIGVLFNGELIDIDNHKDLSTYVHKIMINKNSLLYRILGQDEIMVNSRHFSSVKSTNLNISAISDDNVIEAVECPYKTFFMGLQWHPESLYLFDSNAKKIFDYFVKICGGDRY